MNLDIKLRQCMAPLTLALMARMKLAAALAAALLAGTATAADWKRLESDHFSALANISESGARDFLTRLELLRWLTLKLMGVDESSTSSSNARTEVFLETGRDDDRRFEGNSASTMTGTFLAREETDCLRVSGLAANTTGQRPISQLAEQQVLNEVVVIHLMARHAPMSFPQRWYAKGFSRYVAATQFDNGTLYLGGIHQGDARDLHAGKWLPYRAVLQLDEGDAPPPPGLDVDKFNAQAWWLVHQLMASADGKKQLADYLDRSARGEPRVPAFEAATGRSLDDWESALWTESKETFPVRRVRPDVLPKVEIRRLDIDAATARYVDLLPRLHCENSSAASASALRRALHERVAGAASTDATLTLDLALADLLADDARAAAGRLEAFIGSAPEHGQARLLAARALRRQAATLEGSARAELLERASTHADHAVRLRPGVAEAHRERARILERLGRSDAALAALTEARRLGTFDFPNLAHEATLAMRAGDRQHAVDALQVAAYQVWWPDRARVAGAAIAAIRSGQSATRIAELLDSSLKSTS